MAPIAQPFDQVSGIVSVFDLERSLFYTKISSDSEITATQYNFSRTVYSWNSTGDTLFPQHSRAARRADAPYPPFRWKKLLKLPKTISNGQQHTDATVLHRFEIANTGTGLEGGMH